MIVILRQPETCATKPCNGENTEYCSDSNGNSEFKCVCHDGFDGTRCEYKCPLDCKENQICISEISEIDSTTSVKNWECILANPPEVCEANPCCESGPNPLCCQNGVCSNEYFVYNATFNNADECGCLCTDNFTGSLKQRLLYGEINWTDSLDFINVLS